MAEVPFSNNEIESMAQAVFEYIISSFPYCAEIRHSNLNEIVFEKWHHRVESRIEYSNFAELFSSEFMFQDYSLSKVTDSEEIKSCLEKNLAAILFRYKECVSTDLSFFGMSVIFDYIRGVRRLFSTDSQWQESRLQILNTTLLGLCSLDEFFYGGKHSDYKDLMQ